MFKFLLSHAVLLFNFIWIILNILTWSCWNKVLGFTWIKHVKLNHKVLVQTKETCKNCLLLVISGKSAFAHFSCQHQHLETRMHQNEIFQFILYRSKEATSDDLSALRNVEMKLIIKLRIQGQSPSKRLIHLDKLHFFCFCW